MNGIMVFMDFREAVEGRSLKVGNKITSLMGSLWRMYLLLLVDLRIHTLYARKLKND